MTHVHISGISGITVVRVELYFNVSKKKIKGRGSDTSLTSTLTDDHETESRLLMEKYIFFLQHSHIIQLIDGILR